MAKKNEYDEYFEETRKRVRRLEVGIDAYTNEKIRVENGVVRSDLRPKEIMELSKALNQTDAIRRRMLGLPEKWR